STGSVSGRWWQADIQLAAAHPRKQHSAAADLRRLPCDRGAATEHQHAERADSERAERADVEYLHLAGRIGTLFIGPDGTLDIVGGSLTVLNGVTDNGTIIVEGDPPALTINGPVTIGSSGSFTATGSGDEIEFTNGSVDAKDHGVITFESISGNPIDIT